VTAAGMTTRELMPANVIFTIAIALWVVAATLL